VLRSSHDVEVGQAKCLTERGDAKLSEGIPPGQPPSTPRVRAGGDLRAVETRHSRCGAMTRGDPGPSHPGLMTTRYRGDDSVTSAVRCLMDRQYNEGVRGDPDGFDSSSVGQPSGRTPPPRR
jgi:hypothetical protein